MAERLAGSVTGQKRLVGDTAHQPRAPIARIPMPLGILGQRADEKTEPQVEDLREAVQHMSGLVNPCGCDKRCGKEWSGKPRPE